MSIADQVLGYITPVVNFVANLIEQATGLFSSFL